MIGSKVTLRLRMGAHDAHYAGELVDGARMLALFGDLATELLIRLDGDEGLFRAYESVEFLAPVFAGDYIEATAELVSVGNTSRKMQFVAQKVVSNLRAPGTPPSAADVLSPPLVVCRAVGTCVTPREMQRRPKGLYVPALPAAGPPEASPVVTPDAGGHALAKDAAELVITAAVVGAEVTREQTPHLPVTPQEIADEAARCREAGAAVIHLHVRDDAGSPTHAKERFAETIERMRAKTDCIVQVSTGGAIGMTIDQRAEALASKPEMATLNCGTLNFGDDVFVNSRPQIRDLAARIRAANAVPEMECYEVGHLEEGLALAEKGLVTGTLHFQFVMGIPGGISAREENLRHLVSLLPRDRASTWGVAAVGRHQKPMTELAMRLGGHARVGLEDNIYLEKGVLSEGSAPLVARAAAYGRSIGREVVDPARARALLGIGSRG